MAVTGRNEGWAGMIGALGRAAAAAPIAALLFIAIGGALALLQGEAVNVVVFGVSGALAGILGRMLGVLLAPLHARNA